MNLTNYEKTPILRVFRGGEARGGKYGVNVLESEIVGLVPLPRPLSTPPRTTLQLTAFKHNQA